MIRRQYVFPAVAFAAALLFTAKFGALVGVAPSDAQQPPAPAQPAQPAPAKPDPLTDPITLSQSEIDILQALADRRRQLEEREKTFAEREALLKAAEQRITEKVNELKAVQAKLESLVKKHDGERVEQIKRLVKVYENMKPRDAARIFDQLEEDVLLDVIERMKEVKLAPVLAAMDSKKATAVTTELMKRREIQRQSGLPAPGS